MSHSNLKFSHLSNNKDLCPLLVNPVRSDVSGGSQLVGMPETQTAGLENTEFILIKNKVNTFVNQEQIKSFRYNLSYTDEEYSFKQKWTKNILIVSKETGNKIWSDPLSRYLYKMRKKIFSWAGVTEAKKEVLGNTYALIELSYKDNADWQPRDLTEFIQGVIRSIGKENIYDYAWVFEIKPSGRNLHYHLALHINPSVFIPYPDKSGLWTKGSTHIYRGSSSPYYLVKYLKKFKQKFGIEYPKGSRKYGVWINKNFYNENEIWDIRKASYPAYVVEEAESLEAVEVSVKRGRLEGKDIPGWIIQSKDGKEFSFIESPYKVFTGNHKGDVEMEADIVMGVYNRNKAIKEQAHLENST